jgi:hypothetical protein
MFLLCYKLIDTMELFGPLDNSFVEKSNHLITTNRVVL